MAPPLLTLQGIFLTLGGQPLLEGADLTIAPRERLCLVGRNGSGKSTLLKIAAGEIQQDGGQRFFQPTATIRYLPQEPDVTTSPTTLAYVEAGMGPQDDHYRALYLLNELGLTGDEDTSNLSGGEARRTALARALAPEPDVLLLDEPTNHLDLPAIEWLETELASLRSALVLISHDRRFLSNLTKSTLWLDRGVTRHLNSGFAEFEAWRDTVLEEEERDRHKLDRQIAMEEHWVRYGVSGRRKRNMGRMARLADLRQDKREAVRVTGNVKLEASSGRTSGKMVVEAEDISKSYGERAIVKNFSIRIQRGDRVGIVGPNGAGKTTLIKLLTGELAPDSGEARLGAALEMATLDQRRGSLLPGTTLKDALTGGGSDWVEVNGQRKHVIGYMKDFLFTPEQIRTPVEKLSGGERGRLTLARALALPSNFLVLDEPTNDLDLETLDLLQEMLADYAGTVIVVSHDRDFLDRVATSVIVSEGEGEWMEYAGGYADMVAQRGYGVGATSASKPAERPRAPDPRIAPPKAAAPIAKRRLTFKEKHALDTLPARMAALEASRAIAQKLLDDPALFQRDPKKFTEASKKFAAADTDLAKAEEEWLALELLREGAGV